MPEMTPAERSALRAYAIGLDAQAAKLLGVPFVVPCEIPDCVAPGVADFRVGEREAIQCALHGYIVLSQLGGATTTIIDNAGFWKMVDALRKDGFVVVTEGVGRAS